MAGGTSSPVGPRRMNGGTPDRPQGGVVRSLPLTMEARAGTLSVEGGPGRSGGSDGSRTRAPSRCRDSRQSRCSQVLRASGSGRSETVGHVGFPKMLPPGLPGASTWTRTPLSVHRLRVLRWRCEDAILPLPICGQAAVLVWPGRRVRIPERVLSERRRYRKISTHDSRGRSSRRP